uniref:glutathione transferase n=1 Tax=Steinernema glaseri TaxID=37863 RepID=A0A1I7YV93_9BILA
MVTYKLHYFEGIGGRAELIRLLLNYGGLPYEEVTIAMQDWANQKANYPNGQVPVMEIDGKVLTQSLAIARYLSRKLGLLGRDDWEAAQADAFIGIIEDTIVVLKNEDLLMKMVTGKGNESANEITTALRPFLERLEKHLQTTNGVNLVGDNLTWADLGVADWFKRYAISVPNLFDPFPAVKKFTDSVYSLPKIKEYVAERNVKFF